METLEGEHNQDLHVLRCMEMFNQYESIIASLSDTISFYQDETQQLKAEITTLLAENKQFSDRIEELLKISLERKIPEENAITEDCVLESFRKQLEFALQEKQKAVDLWQESLRKVDSLEQELSLLQSRTDCFTKAQYNKQKEQYENQIKELEVELRKLKEKLVAVVGEHTNLLKRKNEELQKAMEDQQRTKSFVQSLEEELKTLRQRQFELGSMRESITKDLTERDSQIENLRKKEMEARLKMSEALILAENAVLERNAAILRETQAKEDTVKVSQEFERKLQENDLKVKRELQELENLYEEKQRKLCNEIKHLRKQLEAKSVEMESYKSKCQLLEEEIERMKKGNAYIDETNTSRLLVLEKNLESTFQKLLLSERKLIQMTTERDSVKADLEQIRNMYENDTKARDIEKTSLQQKICNLQEELRSTKQELLIVSEKCKQLNSEIEALSTENNKALQSKDERNQKMVEEMKELQDRFERIQKITQRHLNLQQEINDRWQRDTEEMTVKYEKRVLELKEEICVLKKTTTELQDKLNACEVALEHYKRFYNNMCSVVEHISDFTEVQVES